MPQTAFRSPWLLALAVLPGLVPLLYYLLLRKRRRSVLLPTLNLIPSGRRQRSWFPVALLFSCLAMAALVPVIAGIDLARPPEPEPSALMIVLDVSSSMSADDFAPLGRLGEAKKHLQRLVAAAPFTELGIIAYASFPRLMVPATTDRAAAHDAIAAIHEVGYGDDGTAIGSAIASAVNRLRAGDWRRRRILLITDGVNNGGPVSPLDAAGLARSFDIRIDTLGIGTDRVSRFRVPTPDGDTAPVDARIEIDEKTLERVARETGGTYVRARSSQELLESLLALSGAAEREMRKPDSREAVLPARILLVTAIAFLGAGFLLSNFLFPEIPA